MSGCGRVGEPRDRRHWGHTAPRSHDWGVHGPVDCRIGGYKAPEFIRPSDIEFPQQEAIWYQVPEVRTGQLGSGAVRRGVG